MKKKSFNWLLILPVTLFIATFTLAFAKSLEDSEQGASNEIKWMTLAEVEQAQKTLPKPVIVDLYTSWCVWCKKMDESTFSDPGLINYINNNFYALKFDAESEAPVNFNGNDYSILTMNNRKVHGLAWELGSVNGRIGYPTLVVLDEKNNKLQAFPGFKDVDAMNSLVKYFGEGIYKNKSWQDYLSGGH